MTRTVVAYASAHGSTEGIAERIAAGLRAAGHTTVMHPLAKPGDIGDFDCLVVGSAIHGGQWLPGTEHALENLINTSPARPVWAFSVSSIGSTTSVLSTWVAHRLRPHVPEPQAVATLRARADVRSHRFFAGAIRPGDWPGVGRIVFRVMGGRYGDARDWDDIDQWTQQIISESIASG